MFVNSRKEKGIMEASLSQDAAGDRRSGDRRQGDRRQGDRRDGSGVSRTQSTSVAVLNAGLILLIQLLLIVIVCS